MITKYIFDFVRILIRSGWNSFKVRSTLLEKTLLLLRTHTIAVNGHFHLALSPLSILWSAWQMPYADGVDWQVGTQALPWPAGISRATLRDREDDEKSNLEQQGRALEKAAWPLTHVCLLHFSSIPWARTPPATYDNSFRQKLKASFHNQKTLTVCCHASVLFCFSFRWTQTFGVGGEGIDWLAIFFLISCFSLANKIIKMR